MGHAVIRLVFNDSHKLWNISYVTGQIYVVPITIRCQLSHCLVENLLPFLIHYKICISSLMLHVECHLITSECLSALFSIHFPTLIRLASLCTLVPSFKNAFAINQCVQSPGAFLFYTILLKKVVQTLRLGLKKACLAMKLQYMNNG